MTRVTSLPCIWFRLLPILASADIDEIFANTELFPESVSLFNYLDFHPNSVHCVLRPGEAQEKDAGRFLGYSQQRTPTSRGFAPVHVLPQGTPDQKEQLRFFLKVASTIYHPFLWITLSFMTINLPRKSFMDHTPEAFF